MKSRESKECRCDLEGDNFLCSSGTVVKTAIVESEQVPRDSSTRMPRITNQTLLSLIGPTLLPWVGLGGVGAEIKGETSLRIHSSLQSMHGAFEMVSLGPRATSLKGNSLQRITIKLLFCGRTKMFPCKVNPGRSGQGPSWQIKGNGSSGAPSLLLASLALQFLLLTTFLPFLR